MSIASTPGPALSVHNPTSKDFELLRKTDAALDKQISSLSLIRLALFVVITFLFASAIHRRNEDAIQKTLQDIYTTPGVTETEKPILDPLSVYLRITRGDSDNSQLNALVLNLQNQYSQIFTVKFSVLGTDLSFDLRLIIVSFPVWLSLAQIYLSILREKRRLIRYIGFELLSRAGTVEVTVIDKLTFEQKEGPYRSYPRTLIDVSFWLTVIVLLSMMIWITGMKTTDEGRLYVKLGVIVALATAFYSAAYSSLISTRLREQVLARMGSAVPPDRFGRMWWAANHLLVILPSRVRPRLTMTLSALMLLSTLVLQTSQLSCDRVDEETEQQPSPAAQAKPQEQPKKDVAGDTRSGYQLLKGNADWPPSLFSGLEYAANNNENYYGRILYKLSLLLALAGLLRAAFIRQKWTRILALPLSYVCAALSVALLCEFANPWFWGSWTWTIVPSLTLVFYVFARLSQRSKPRRADRIYRSLRMAYVPLLFADSMFLASVLLRVPGLVVLFFAVHAMTLGYFSTL
jgi:hypothetical protein